MFEETHRLAISLINDGLIDGLRIDHPDGLADPQGYLERLRDAGVEHVWVEKILDPGETLRASWPVEGTVGYEFLNDVQAVYVDPAGEERLTALWHDLSGDPRPFSDYAAEAKLEQASTTFTAEVERLARSFPRDDLPEALSSLPVYRTYIRDGHASAEDREVLAEAGIEWLLDAPPEFVTRFQQTTPPVMAKGVEDTAFYRYLRLLALNDVGGDPGRFGLPIADFHAANAERPPLNLLVTQTHDTKRSGDVRARIGAIAGMAEAWEAHVRGWLELTSEVPGPDDAERYLVFQTLAGAWPIEPERLDGYLEKALREAKRTTTWIDPDDDARGGGEGVRARADRAAGVPRRLRPVRGRARGGGRAGGARPAAAQAHRAGAAGHLQRRRAPAALAGRPRQPPPGRLGRAARRRSPRCGGARTPTRSCC